MNDVFQMSFDGLPLSTNKYLAPSVVYKGGKAFPYLRETKEAKEFKAFYGNAVKRKVRDDNWDIKQTETGHWYLDCSFTQSRTNEDSSNYLKILMDALTGILYVDDKNILPRIDRVSYNPKNPNFTIILRPVEYEGLFNDRRARSELIDKQCSSCRFYKDGACSVLKSATEGRVTEHYEPRDNICFKFIKRKSDK